MVWRRLLGLLSRERRTTGELQWLLTDGTQLDGARSGSSPIQLVVGLDFGTSFTKVVVGEPRVHYAVPFGDFSRGRNPYLLPSAVSTMEGGDECMLGVDAAASRVFDNLKMPLIDRDFSEEVQGRAVAFLALVLRYVRGWLFSTHGRTYKNRRIEWFVSVGLPTDSYDDQTLAEVYLDIARAAWRLSVLPGPISLTRSINYLTVTDQQLKRLPKEFSDRFLAIDRVSAFPEFAAQLAGYVRSPRHQEDLHAMVDVGGGTLDVTVFNVVKRESGDLFPIFARAVRPLGTRYLLRNRFEELGLPDEGRFSPFDDLPTDEEFGARNEVTIERLAEADRTFRRGFMACIEDALLHTRQNRYPMSRHWESGVPTFFCGGGASSEFYSRLLLSFEAMRPPFRLRTSDLPDPDDLDAPLLVGGSYNRLAIAYGLSFDPFDIGEVQRMSEIDDVEDATVTVPYTESFISKDMM